MSSTINTDVVNGAVDALFTDHGYTDGTGVRSLLAVAEAMYPLVEKARVNALAERASKCAFRRPNLLAAAFPNLPGPEDWANEPDPTLAEAVYREADRLVWERLKPAPNGDVQTLVGLRTPALVLVRTKANPGKQDAVYVTDDRACLLADYIDPLRIAAQRVATRYGAHSALVGSRIPDLAEVMDRDYTRSMRTAIGAGRQLILATLPSGNDEPEED